MKDDGQTTLQLSTSAPALPKAPAPTLPKAASAPALQAPSEDISSAQPVVPKATSAVPPALTQGFTDEQMKMIELYCEQLRAQTPQDTMPTVSTAPMASSGFAARRFSC